MHAVVILIVAAAGYLTYLTHRQSSHNAALLSHHLDEHVDAAIERQLADPGPLVEPPPSASPAP